MVSSRGKRAVKKFNADRAKQLEKSLSKKLGRKVRVKRPK